MLLVTHSLGDQSLTYEWLLGDGIENKVEVVHSYAEPSEYDIELTIRNSAGEEETLNSQFLFMKIFYSFSNRSEQKERIAQFITAARTRYLCDLWRPLVQNRSF